MEEDNSTPQVNEGNNEDKVLDLTETEPTEEEEGEAKEELGNMRVPENPAPVVQPVNQGAQPLEPTQTSQPVVQPVPAVKPQGQSGTIPLETPAQQVEAQQVQQPQIVGNPAAPTSLSNQNDPMKLLQYQCENCELKTYINFDDDLKGELGEKIKCPNCGKKKSFRKRIFDMILKGYKPYEEVAEQYKQ